MNKPGVFMGRCRCHDYSVVGIVDDKGRLHQRRETVVTRDAQIPLRRRMTLDELERIVNKLPGKLAATLADINARNREFWGGERS